MEFSQDTLFLLKIFTYTIIFAILIITTLIVFIIIRKRQIQARELEKDLQRQEAEQYRNKLLEKVKEKIAVTQRAENKFIKGEDLVADCIYRQSNIDQLGTDIRNLFEKQLGTLKTQYPSLTDLDILVIVLLGIGMDNVEICALLHMEKRTLYRRRQLIAQRIGISSLSIEEFALHLLEEEE